MKHRHSAPARPPVLFRRSRAAALREALAADPKALLLCADADAPQGSIIGKALTSLASATGEISMLVTLR